MPNLRGHHGPIVTLKCVRSGERRVRETGRTIGPPSDLRPVPQPRTCRRGQPRLPIRDPRRGDWHGSGTRPTSWSPDTRASRRPTRTSTRSSSASRRSRCVVEAVILVAHDQDGNVTVQKTGDDLGRTGAKWGGSVGFLVGLAAPPLLAATVVGAAAGGVLGRIADHKLEQGLHDKLGEAHEAGHGRHHRHVRHRPAAGRRAGPARVACEVGRPDRQEGAPRPSRIRSRRRWASSTRTDRPCPSPTAPSAAWPVGRSRIRSPTG